MLGTALNLLNNSLLHSLPILCERFGFSSAETFLPSHNQLVFNQSGQFTPGVDEEGGARSLSNTQGSKVNEAFVNQKWVEVTREELVEELQATHKGCGGGYVVPFSFGENLRGKGLMVFYVDSAHQGSAGLDMDFIQGFCSRLVQAGLDLAPEVCTDAVSREDALEAFEIINAQGVFDPNTIYNELELFYNLELPQYYFNHFPVAIQAAHINAFIASRRYAATISSPDKLWLHVENNALFMGKDEPEQALLMCPDRHLQKRGAEKNLENAIRRIPSNLAFSLEYLVSEKPIPGGKEKLGIYVLETNAYSSTADAENNTNIWDIAPESFNSLKAAGARQRYQSIIELAQKQLSPCTIQSISPEDNLTNVMLAYTADSASPDRNHDVNLTYLTELMHRNDLKMVRKFAQSFANGTIVYSLYFDNPDQASLDNLCDEFKLLYSLPLSTLTKEFVAGTIDKDTYLYGSCAGRFVYYFMNQRSDEYDALTETLKDDPENSTRLRLLHTSLKREAVGLKRIWQSMRGHGELLTELVGDFKTRVKMGTGEEGDVEALKHRIHMQAYSPLDEQILNALLSFNRGVRKTNCFAADKASVAFRMDPSVMDSDWPEDPYGLFFLVSIDYQGFHVRFRDISRGGIRMIQSRDLGHYNTNLSTLFAENYGLAYTQNKKNKDIPEFGSKGTVLLSPNSQGNAFTAFKKYISGLMDMMVPKEGVYDHLGQEELLFLGPDEGTANMMEWAARYAKERGYKYWKSITTGKPPSLGGIPHDTYGMTTRSVRQYAEGIIDELGLDQTKCTKFQTGGPDGDLGSNEILLSTDQTTSIVDGSGVLHDPNGLNRDELERLANERVMIDQFDASKLSDKGFKILVGEDNVTLPDGTLVESGLAFRNNFHLNPLSSADFFVPCGGRPESVSLSNVHELLFEDGTPRFKYVVEGANLFFTNDARSALEEKGVVVFKDASTNKGGVTSSSLEVLAALALSDKEFKMHMSVNEDGEVPKFYQEYVQEIQNRVEADARHEFNCIWKEHQRTGEKRFVLTERVSDKINELNDFVQASVLYDNPQIRSNVLQVAIPHTLTAFLGLDEILRRVPETYIKAIFAAYLSSRYVYKFGVHAHEFSFFEFMQDITSSAGAAGEGQEGQQVTATTH